MAYSHDLFGAWDAFISNPYTKTNHQIDEDALNDLLNKSMADIILSEEQFESIKQSYENSKAESTNLKAEKKELEEKEGGKLQRSIQEELRSKQLQKEIKSAKLRYKRQGNKMRRSERFSLSVTQKLEKLIDCIKDNEINKERILFLIILFCINTLDQIETKFALNDNDKNIERIFKHLVHEKKQTKPIFGYLLTCVHSYAVNVENVTKIISIFNERNHECIWILYVLCCAFPVLFISQCIETLSNSESQCILLHHLLPKYPLICLKMINENECKQTLKMMVNICSFHPKLWQKVICCQPFCKKIFSLFGDTENECDLLFNFEHFIINGANNKDLALNFGNFVSGIIISLNDFEKCINHSVDIKYDATKSCFFRFLCQRFESLKNCDLKNLILHREVLKLLCLMDKAFLFRVIVQMIVDFDDIDSKKYNFLFEEDVFSQFICFNIDIIAYYATKKRFCSTQTIKNLYFVCTKLNILFNVNLSMLNQMAPLLKNVDFNLLNLLKCINTKQIKKNIATLLCRSLFEAMINAKCKKLKNGLIESMLQMCEFNDKVKKELIELCISHILCPQMNGKKIQKLVAKKSQKQKPKKRLKPKMRINLYANALMKQMNEKNINFDKIVNNQNNDQQNIEKNEQKNNEQKDKKEDKECESVWYLLTKLSSNFVPYFANFIEMILIGTHLEPSQSKYAECIQKGTVLMFDHDILCLFQSHPNLLKLFKLFCQTTKVSEDNSSHCKIFSYLRSLCVSHYIECAKYTKSKRANCKGMDIEKKDFKFYNSSILIFECLYLSGKISIKLYKVIGILCDLNLSEIGKIFRHVCTLCLQPIPPQNAMKQSPAFPLKLDEKMLIAEKRVIRQILLQNEDLLMKHADFVASVFA